MAEVLARYPYDPKANTYELRGLEKLRAVAPCELGLREACASLYLAAQERWLREELTARGKVLQAQSREHLDELPPDESERKYP